MPDDASVTINRVIVGDGRERTFQVGHAFTSVLTVRVLEAGDREVLVDTAMTAPSQVAIIFDAPPAVGKPYMVYITGR